MARAVDHKGSVRVEKNIPMTQTATTNSYTNEISEDDFYTIYKPVESPDGSLFWDRDEALRRHPKENVIWTAVDGDETNDIFLLPGWHIVNAIDGGTVIASKPRITMAEDDIIVRLPSGLDDETDEPTWK